MFYYLLLFIFLLIIIFCLYSRKYNNPYKNIFIFGKKGSGKSTLMVREILKHQKRGWICYTDLNVNIPGVRHFNPQDLAKCTPEENSFVCVDEAGILFDNRNFANFDKGFTLWFKLQRHYHCKVMLNSQTFDIDKKIRDVTDSMILQSNIGNILSISRPIVMHTHLVESTAESDSRIAEDLKFDKIWRWKIYFMPRYFKYFNSFDAPQRPKIPYTLTGSPIERSDGTA